MQVNLEKLREDGVSRSEAVKIVCDILGVPKAKVYKEALRIVDWRKAAIGSG